MKAVPLAESLDETCYGGKAARLAEAIRAGLPVPNGVALSVNLVDGLSNDQLDATQALEVSCVAVNGPLAVRSSAVGEDSETVSFAGQHLTCLNVPASLPALIDAIRAIWQSGHSESALAYRKRMGITSEPKIGVVVQELVNPDRAGVLFTRNPTNGADEIVIEASWGLGESVVAGLVTPDRFRISPDGTVLERMPGMKDIAIRMSPEGGTREAAVAAECMHALSLDDAQLRQLHSLAIRCENVFGGAQDLEWAFASRALYLLQCRAATRIVNVEHAP